jgi:hypothetical protein
MRDEIAKKTINQEKKLKIKRFLMIRIRIKFNKKN